MPLLPAKHRRRMYTSREARIAAQAAIVLANVVQHHGGTCKCKLCKAWLEIHAFKVCSLQTMNALEPNVVMEDIT